MSQEIIDVHVHCFTGRAQAGVVSNGLEELRREGLRTMAVLGMVNTHFDSETIWNLVPRYVENQGDPLFHEAEDLLELARLNDPLILPLVDTRYLFGEVSAILKAYIKQGFRGLKGIYLADDGNDLGVGNVPDTFGISLEQYQRREWAFFEFAEANDLPMVYHMDARRYGDVMKALLDDFPRVRVDFAHFGIGRRAMGKFLDRYPNVFTDLAALLPHMQNNPASYRDFILHYADRVCFGSDAVLYRPETVLDYVRMVRALELPKEVETQVFSRNPRKFLGCALDSFCPHE